MPELPDLTVYLEALDARIVGQRLERLLIRSPFLLRTAEPPIESAQGRRVTEVRRIGKRLAIGLEGDLWLVFHLMIAGRLHWIEPGARSSRRAALARLEFNNGALTLTEAGTKRRASLKISAAGVPCARSQSTMRLWNLRNARCIWVIIKCTSSRGSPIKARPC